MKKSDIFCSTAVLLVSFSKINSSDNPATTANHIIQISFSQHFKLIESIIEIINQILDLIIVWSLFLK